MFGGKNTYFFDLFQNLCRYPVNLGDAFYFITEKGDPVNEMIIVGRSDLQCISPDTEGAGFQVYIIPAVLAFDKLAEQGVSATNILKLQ